MLKMFADFRIPINGRPSIFSCRNKALPFSNSSSFSLNFLQRDFLSSSCSDESYHKPFVFCKGTLCNA